MEKFSGRNRSLRQPPWATILARCRRKGSRPSAFQWRRQSYFPLYCRRQYLTQGKSSSRFGNLGVDPTYSSVGSNSMARRRDKDVNWSPKVEEQLLRLLGEFNLLSSAGNTPNRDKYMQWATVLSSHFSAPVSWDKVKQKVGRLKRTFDAEFLLRNATGLGWDPIEKKPTCTEEYWQQFISSHPEVEKARKKPLTDYDLYYCAFANTRATGAHEYGQEKIPASPPHPPENLPGSPIDVDSGQSQFNEFGDTSFTKMRQALHQTGRVPHLASQSRLISKRSSINSHTRSPTFMERVMDRLVSCIEQNNCSRGKSSATPNSVVQETYEDKCFDLLGELEIPQDQYLFMFNFLTLNVTLQRPFLRMKEHHRLMWIKQTMDSQANQNPHANQQFLLPPPPPQMHALPGHFQYNTPLNPQSSYTFQPNFQPTSSTFQPYNASNFSPFSGRHGGDGSSHPNL